MTEKPNKLPRVWIEWNELSSGKTPTCLSDEEQFNRKKPGQDHNNRYLSLTEHATLLEEARKEARADSLQKLLAPLPKTMALELLNVAIEEIKKAKLPAKADGEVTKEKV